MFQPALPIGPARTMPSGLVLSVIVAVLFVAATWLTFSGLRAGGAR